MVEGIGTDGHAQAARAKSELIAATSYYSTDYFAARERFLTACTQSGFDHHSLRVHAPSPRLEPLTIDIAIAGAETYHGARVIERRAWSRGLVRVGRAVGVFRRVGFADYPPARAAVVLIHAVNPFGFAWVPPFQ